MNERTENDLLRSGYINFTIYLSFPLDFFFGIEDRSLTMEGIPGCRASYKDEASWLQEVWGTVCEGRPLLQQY